MNTLFTFALLIAAAVVVVAVIGAVYVAVGNRRSRQEPERREATAGTTEAAPREYYKRLGLETSEEMKMRLYSLDEYARDLGGDPGTDGSSRFVAVLKAYRQIDDDWYDYPPHKAAEVLELEPDDYEVDGERGVLLLKRFPPGLPVSARDV